MEDLIQSNSIIFSFSDKQFPTACCNCLSPSKQFTFWVYPPNTPHSFLFNKPNLIPTQLSFQCIREIYSFRLPINFRERIFYIKIIIIFRFDFPKFKIHIREFFYIIKFLFYLLLTFPNPSFCFQFISCKIIWNECSTFKTISIPIIKTDKTFLCST